MAKLVSNVYGDALFELALEQQRLDDYLDEAQCIKEALADNPDFPQVMTHPKVTKEDKLNTLEAVFKGRVSDEVVGLMRMVVEKSHFADMPDILDYFIARVMEEKNIGVATVVTAVELDAQQKEAVEARLLETTPYVSFHMSYSVQPSLIGGMVIRIGDRVVDSSVASKLELLARELSK